LVCLSISLSISGVINVARPNACIEKTIPILSLACDPGSHTVVAGTELEAYQASVALWLVATSCHGSIDGVLISAFRDIRTPGNIRQQYVESHNDDVTEVSPAFNILPRTI
jgi:hypothetical protein